MRPLATFVMVILSNSVWGQALPYPKNGQCASGYYNSGGYCMPMSEKSKPAVPKVGQCPSGWAQSGNACRKT